MEILDVRACLELITPGGIYGWRGGDNSDLDNVIWRDVEHEMPTKREVDATWARANANGLLIDDVPITLKQWLEPDVEFMQVQRPIIKVA